MTTTPALRRQWKLVEGGGGRIAGYLVPFDVGFIEVRKSDGTNLWEVASPNTGYWRSFSATTAEEAITEAVVAVTQYLNGLLEDLATIPTTLPPAT